MIISAQHNILQRLESLSKLVGNTPLYQLSDHFGAPNVKIHAKLEWQQFGNSVKTRAAYGIIKTAIKNGDLHEGKTLIDASSGNTAIAYASIAAAIGINVQLYIPANASQERKDILHRLGAQLVFTSPLELTDGAQLAAKEAYEAQPEKYFYADQYSNENNWKAHYHGTANEIIDQTEGQLTHFVTGLGTTGTFTGTARKLQETLPHVQSVELQPDFPMHGLEGWKHLETAKVPTFYDKELAHQRLLVSSMNALELVKEVARKEGLLISPSAAANLAGAIQLSHQLTSGVIVTVFPDGAEKYGEAMKQIFTEH